MNKQQLSEALEAWDQRDWSRQVEAVAVVRAAARLVERLLPGECPNPMHGRPFSPNAIDVPDHCPDCVDGQVWDEGIVEAVATAISLHLTGDRDSQFAAPAIARAVLSVLVELLTEKVKR